MKKMKRIMCFLLAAVMTLSVGFAVNGTEAKAADENARKAPKAVRVGVGERYSSYVTIPLASKTDVVKNIKVYKGKSKTKNVVLKRVEKSSYETDAYVRYAVRAKKAGNYTVKYNVYADGKKKGKTQKFTVYAQGYGNSISKVTVNKKNITKFINAYTPSRYYYTTKNTVKMKFTPAKGCKIKKVEMIYRDKNGKEVTKKIKNGKKVKLGQYAEAYSSENYSGKDLYAETTFKVTYKDRCDDEENTYYVYVMKKTKKTCKYVYED